MGLTVGGKTIDLRVATPADGLRREDRHPHPGQGRRPAQARGAGVPPGASFNRYEESFIKPYGAILVTGPTGSGKSTTLYATLNILNKPDRNIITVEDPVEYRLPGINQMQMNPRAGLTFASALRSILRADPDILLVGEIRDRETALIAIEAALTGHLVLSTLHTNDAPSALPRLIEMGVEPYLVASAIDCVVAQRLARKLCVEVPGGVQARDVRARRHAGTRRRTSSRDRDAVPGLRVLGVRQDRLLRADRRLYEVMSMTEEIERLTVDRVSSDEIRQAALRDGMHTLRQDGLQKIRRG